MRQCKKIYILIVLICICIALLYSINIKDNDGNSMKNELKTSTIEKYKNGNIKQRKLMIVAHPDDETIWGGANLLKDDYVVVCVTCGVSDIRSEEFKKVMQITNDEYIMLGYPDKINGVISNWEYIYDSIESNLKNIINEGNYEKIVTHNPDGEYGHIHHKMISKMVTENADKDKLYYFGHYYKNSSLIPTNSKMIDKMYYDRKVNDLIEIYKSQQFIKNSYNHMFPYENWIQYYNWDNVNI